MTRVFISKPHNYPNNIREGAEINAAPAWLSAPEGPVPGIIVRSNGSIRFIIPEADAIRLATEIVRSLDSLKTTETEGK